MVKKKSLICVLLAGLICIVIASCAHQPYAGTYDPPGFLMGLVHGAILLFSFFTSIFMDHRIYAFPNSGFWYDCGFVFGLPGSVFFLLVLR